MGRDDMYKGSTDKIATVPISPALHRRLRVHLAEEGRTTKWFITKLIEKHLAHQDWLKANGVVEDEDATTDPNQTPLSMKAEGRR